MILKTYYKTSTFIIKQSKKVEPYRTHDFIVDLYMRLKLIQIKKKRRDQQFQIIVKRFVESFTVIAE